MAKRRFTETDSRLSELSERAEAHSRRVPIMMREVLNILNKSEFNDIDPKLEEEQRLDAEHQEVARSAAELSYWQEQYDAAKEVSEEADARAAEAKAELNTVGGELNFARDYFWDVTGENGDNDGWEGQRQGELKDGYYKAGSGSLNYYVFGDAYDLSAERGIPITAEHNGREVTLDASKNPDKEEALDLAHKQWRDQ